MVDFLKAFPFVTMEEYKWKYSVPMIKLMSMDNTRIHYKSDKEIEKTNTNTINSAEDLFRSFGAPVINNNDKKDEQ